MSNEVEKQATVPLLEVRGLVKQYGGLTAVDGVSIAIQPNQVVGLVGPNGAGKTTLINAVSGFVKPTSGTVVYKGHSIYAWPAHRLAAHGLVRTFQHAHCLPSMTLRNALITAGFLRVRGQSLLGLRGLWASRSARNALVEESEGVLERLRLERWGTHLGSDVPYGIKKRIGIGMALMSQPELLLLDEPAAGLNSAESEDLSEVVRDLKDGGLTIVIIEHNMPLIMSVSDWVYVLDHGRNLADGSPADIVSNELVIGAYLGRR